MPNDVRIQKGYWDRNPLENHSDRVLQHYWSGSLYQAGHYRPASEAPFKWCFAGRPIMARLPIMACFNCNLDPTKPKQRQS